METFACSQCSQLLFFENSACLSCGAGLGFIPERLAVCALADLPDHTFRVQGGDGTLYRRCERAEIATCNWMVRTDSQTSLCVACALTQHAPPMLGDPMAPAFAVAEMAKRRLIAQLLDLGLPVTARAQPDDGGLCFVLEASSPDRQVLTGHANGMITLNLAEADSVYREEIRLNFGEPYRTLLGHFRHEIGHYYWNRLIENTPQLEAFRSLFGDERQDYSQALQNHYGGTVQPSFQESYVSAYASSHPWEDWAETFAHYLHIRDVLQTAAAFRLMVRGPTNDGQEVDPQLKSQPELVSDQRPFAQVLRQWLPLTYALNALNRSMGKDDLYPFVLAPAVITKLSFVHDVIRNDTRGSAAACATAA